MKIKGEYILREIAGETVAVPVGGTVLSSNVLIALNSSGLFLWQLLANGGTQSELVSAICAEYDVDAETAEKDLLEFCACLKSNKVELE